MIATVALSQDSGVSGPTGRIETTRETFRADARAWAESQTGWPWDTLTVNLFDDDEDPALAEPIESENIDP